WYATWMTIIIGTNTALTRAAIAKTVHIADALCVATHASATPPTARGRHVDATAIASHASAKVNEGPMPPSPSVLARTQSSRSVVDAIAVRQSARIVGVSPSSHAKVRRMG